MGYRGKPTSISKRLRQHGRFAVQQQQLVLDFPYANASAAHDRQALDAIPRPAQVSALPRPEQHLTGIARYKLTAATPSDMEWLDVLRRDVYADLFRATWGAWDEDRHVRHFAESIERGHIQIIKIADERVGMIQVFNRSDALEVGEIQIQPKDQNRGIGSRVLLDILSKAHAQGQLVRLSVALKNNAALRLYERLGFRRVAQSETHIHLESKL